MKFYTKSKRDAYKKASDTNLDFLNLLSNQTKLNMNWDLVKKGFSVNQVFKDNPCGLDSFITGSAVNQPKVKQKQVKVPVPPKARYISY